MLLKLVVIQWSEAVRLGPEWSLRAALGLARRGQAVLGAEMTPE